MTTLPHSTLETKSEPSSSFIELDDTGAPTKRVGAQLFEACIYLVIEAYDEDNADFQLQQLINNNQDLQDHLAEGQIEEEIKYEP